MRLQFTVRPLARRLFGFILAHRRPSAAVAAMLLLMVSAMFYYAHMAPVPVAPIEAPRTELNDQERMLAQTIFHAQARGDYEFADQLMAQIGNQILLGHMLAQRYLDPSYRATGDELTVWLANYRDHPEAARIKALAQAKGVDIAVAVTQTPPLRGDGFIDHLGRRAMADGYYRGLARWKDGAYGPALKEFAAAAEAPQAGAWQKSAAYYWAFRAANALQQKDDALGYLEKAGEYPVTFYGQLANQRLGNHAALMASAPNVPDSLREHPAVLRARALAAAGQGELAEDELRQLVMQLDRSDRPAVLAIAGELGLANLQVRLAHLEGLSGEEKLFAQYPMPPWFLQVQSPVDPALVLSVARQESVFRDDVKSTLGATGMMQMLPSTARHVEASLSPQTVALASADNSVPLSKQLDDPAVNVHLGAQYLALLSKQPMVKGDLIRLIAAYNAGPGSVQSWQGAARKIADPLLYIESIPYPETRNYVMQVLAHQWVYQTLMGEDPHGLVTLANGQWPVLG